MFDELHIRTLEDEQGSTYVHALDFAQHLMYAGIGFQAMTAENPATDERIAAMDTAAVETLRMVAQLLLQGEDVEYLRNHIDTPEDLFAEFGND